jgi:cell division septation protein DedD
MTTYTIDAENSITALGSQQADFEGEIFASQQELANLAAKWPAHRLVEVWNGIPGLTAVKRFTDRQSAVGRIWKAIQSLDGGGTAETPEPSKAATTPAPKPAKKKTKGAKTAAKATQGKPGKAASKLPAARDGSKKAEILGMLQRKGGATLAQILQATGWQAHSVRGFISGALGKKMGLTIGSVRREDGERVYSIA